MQPKTIEGKYQLLTYSFLGPAIYWYWPIIQVSIIYFLLIKFHNMSFILVWRESKIPLFLVSGINISKKVRHITVEIEIFSRFCFISLKFLTKINETAQYKTNNKYKVQFALHTARYLQGTLTNPNDLLYWHANSTWTLAYSILRKILKLPLTKWKRSKIT